MKVEGMPTPSRSSSETLGPDFLPLHYGNVTGQSSTHAQHVESERDGSGTIVNEVTVTITSIAITRKRYRVKDA